MTNGVVAAGSHAAADAGAFILRRGGNAVDALIAAQLSACVAEPLLTGLAGAGIAMLSMNGNVEVLDCFTALPSKAGTNPPRCVPIQFGAVTQDFWVGWGSVGVPGILSGIVALHERHGSIPLSVLAEPALSQAKSGVSISQGMSTILGLLRPIFQDNPLMRQWLMKENAVLQPGDCFYNPAAESDIQNLIRHPKTFFTDGPVAEGLALCADSLSLTSADCLQYKAIWRDPIVRQWCDARVYFPPPPSSGGVMLDYAIEEAKISKASLSRSELIDVLLHIAKRPRAEIDEEVYKRSAGMTTHISVVDGEGRLAALTSSLGESAGEVLPGTGMILNNFLGEPDVYPSVVHSRIQTGERLMTMCTPTLVDTGESKTIMGAGGSSRIRSAILHGIHQSVLGTAAQDIVTQPRVHCEGTDVYIETYGLSEIELQQLMDRYPAAIEFSEPGIFFGGLNIAQHLYAQDSTDGASDPRRSGVTIKC